MSEERELYDVRPYFESPHKDDAPPKWPQVAKSRRQSFARRYGMTLDCALAGVPPAPHLRVKLGCAKLGCGGER